MGTKINKAAYKELIEEDLEWLAKQPDTLERSHIEQIIECSINLYYPDKVNITLGSISVSDFDIRKYASDQAQEYTDCEGEQSEIEANILEGGMWVRDKLTTH